MTLSNVSAARPHVLIVGLAKSGTTFISKSIAASCDAPPVEYVMEPKEPHEFERGARALNNTTIVVKAIFEHWKDRADYIIGDAAGIAFKSRIAIIRDPRDTLISRLLYRPMPLLAAGAARPHQVESWARALEARERNPAIGFFETFKAFDKIFPKARPLQAEISGVRKLVEDFSACVTDGSGRFSIIRYEDALSGDYSAIEPTLGWPVAQSDDLGRFSYTRRAGQAGGWRAWMQGNDIERLRPLFGAACTCFGYDDWNYEPHTDHALNPAHHSAYTRELLAQYRQQGGAMRSFLQRMRARLKL